MMEGVLSFLDGDYEELGFLAWSWPNGNGHVFNYIYRDGWYYFIDLTHYTSDVMTPETGNMAAYRCVERPLGSLHKAKDPQAYIDYYLRSADNDPPARFRMYKGDHVMPLACVRDEDGNATLYVPEEYEFTEYAGVKFTAMVKRGRLWACQFHPEKSGRIGLELLKEWLSC